MSRSEEPAPPMVDRYAVVGNPVHHSQSPFIHAMFARDCAQTLHYGRLLCETERFAAELQRFAASVGDADGTSGPARGCNVTIPFKFQAHDLAQRRSERALLAGAANTLRFDQDGWSADNTDGAGLVRDIESNAGVELRQRSVLLLGAGGAAAGALGALLQARPGRLQVVNRTAGKATELIVRHRALADSCGVELSAGGLDDAAHGFDVVINASASSLQAQAVPLAAAVLRPGTLALDMMYGPPAAGFIDWAAENGASGRDGLGMLVEQAAESFLFWRGVRPRTTDVLPALRQRLQTRAG